MAKVFLHSNTYKDMWYKKFLASFMCRVIASAINEADTTSFAICILFIFFPCLIVLAKISSTALNRRDSEHSCRFLTLGEVL